jgi:hypothetical protein
LFAVYLPNYVQVTTEKEGRDRGLFPLFCPSSSGLFHSSLALVDITGIHHCFVPPLPGADADGLLHRIDEDKPISGIAGVGGGQASLTSVSLSSRIMASIFFNMGRLL